eukprot:1151075-Pelagomonas_calceolata.AAC.3
MMRRGCTRGYAQALASAADGHCVGQKERKIAQSKAGRVHEGRVTCVGHDSRHDQDKERAGATKLLCSQFLTPKGKPDQGLRFQCSFRSTSLIYVGEEHAVECSTGQIHEVLVSHSFWDPNVLGKVAMLGVYSPCSNVLVSTPPLLQLLYPLRNPSPFLLCFTYAC